jgi:ABC-2 type transport system permease protein
MNSTIAYLTFRGMLGRRRTLLLFLLPAMLIVLAIVLRGTGNNDLETTTTVMQKFGVAVLLPILALIIGTGVIGPEIDDGQIMYVLTKPIPRHVITTTKLFVSFALIAAFGVVPGFIAAYIMAGATAQLAGAFAIGMLVGGITYCSIFIALAVATRFAVVIGLLYVLVWESLIGNFATGAKSASVQQWALSVTDLFTSATAVTSEVSLGTAVTALVLVSAAGALLAAVRLRTMPIASAE